MSRIIDLGKVMVSLSGEWQRDASYEYLTAVEHKGSGYISKVDNIGVEPGTDEDVWMRFAKAGESPEVTKDAKGNIYVNGELLTTAFADAEAAAIRIAETNTSIRAAEQARVNAENARVTAERLRAEAEGLRQQAENGRKSSEGARVSAENARSGAENARSSAETTRQQNENARVVAEGERRSWYGEAKRKIDSFDDSNIRRISNDLGNLKTSVRTKYDSGNILDTALSLAGAVDAGGLCSVSETHNAYRDSQNGGAPETVINPTEAEFNRAVFSINETNMLTITERGGNGFMVFFPGTCYKIVIENIEQEGFVPAVSHVWGKHLGVMKYIESTYSEYSEDPSEMWAAHTFEFIAPVTIYDYVDDGLFFSGRVVELGTGPNGVFSHTEGVETVAYNYGEHAEGKWNKSTPGVTMFSIGCGTSAANRKNAVEVDKNGKVFILGVGGYDGTNPDEADDLATVLSE